MIHVIILHISFQPASVKLCTTCHISSLPALRSSGAFLRVNIGFGVETKDKRTELLCLPGCPVTGSRAETAFPSDCRFCCCQGLFRQWCFSCESAVAPVRGRSRREPGVIGGSVCVCVCWWTEAGREIRV